MTGTIARPKGTSRNTLIFIDTNIFLDFYKASGRDQLTLLDHLDKNHARIITTEQVEMEYKRSRLRVISAALSEHKLPGQDLLPPVPTFLEAADATRMLKKHHKQLKEASKKITARMKMVQRDPRSDPVYVVLQRLFKANGEFHLTRNQDKNTRRAVRCRARKRFLMGYPPRKKDDTSMGDAINWEWIIECAEKSGDDIVIVSRDSDFGAIDAKPPILNDWLRHEFNERLTRKRKIKLTTLLSDAYKEAGIPVSARAAQNEKKFVKGLPTGKVIHGTTSMTQTSSMTATGTVSHGTAFGQPVLTEE